MRFYAQFFVFASMMVAALYGLIAEPTDLTQSTGGKLMLVIAIIGGLAMMIYGYRKHKQQAKSGL